MNNMNFMEVRCFAEPIGNLGWQAFCIDLDLAAQGESFEDVREKLDSQIEHYVRDAVVGPDKQFRDQLLSRKSPLSLRLRYYRIAANCFVAEKLNLAKAEMKHAIAFVERPSAPAYC